MAVLYIAEYTHFPVRQGNVVQAPNDPPVAEQTVAIGAGSVQSAAFNAKTRVLRIHTDAICSILIGPDPTATAAKARLAANQTEYRVVQPGDKLAVITNT